MSWGYKILSAYLVFVAGIIFLVFQSSREKVDLVTKDYYEQELVYQDKIDQSVRAAALSADIQYHVQDNHVAILFPAEMKGRELSASVHLYCPSDSKRDITRDLTSNTGSVNMEFPDWYKGSYELRINWTADGKSYYSTKKLFIQ